MLSTRNTTFKKSVCTLSIFLAVASAPLAHAQERWSTPSYEVFGEAPSPGDEAAINDLLEAFKAAWRSEDGGRLAALHTDDVEWTNAFARIIRTSAALEDFTSGRMFPGFASETSEAEIENMELVSLRFVGNEAAVVHFYTDSPRGVNVETQRLRRVHMHFVLAKQSGDGTGPVWKIAHAVFMDARL
ncbi:MAG: DUF4440 domain-containing protein [Pseudomonadota bacterium]